MNDDSPGITVQRNENKITCIGCIDKDSILDHIIIVGISSSKTNPNDLLVHYWFINPDGSIRDKPKDFPNPSFLDVNFILRIGLFLCFLGATAIVISRIRNSKRS